MKSLGETCSRCGALVGDGIVHAGWHRDLDARIKRAHESQVVLGMYDTGGTLPPGVTIASNDTGEPEKALPPAQGRETFLGQFRGHVLCPACGKGAFHLENWETYVAVTCRRCGYRMRELDASWFSDYPKWNVEDEK